MTTTTHHETEITADPDLPVITITREFDAPPELVFRAHTDPELFARWVGPKDMGITIERWDASTGGHYAFVNTRGSEEYRFFGSFHEIRPDERIVQTFTFEGAPDGVSLETATFEDLGDGRTRLVGVSVVDSLEARDAMIASGMESGVNDGYDKLDALLAELG